MKIFTHSIAIILAIAISPIVYSQTYDLEVTDVVTVANSSNEVPAETEANILMSFVNNGPDPIPANTPLWVAIQVNASYYTLPDTFSINVPIPAAASFTYTSLDDWFFAASTPNYEICAGAFFVDSTLEADPTNNFYCEDFVATSAVSKDWAVTMTTIQEPTNLDGFDLEDNTETVPPFDSVTFTLTNESDLTFPRLYGMSFLMAFDGDTSALNAVFGGNVDPAQSSNYFINSGALPTQTQDSGTYDLCIIANDQPDAVDSNNASCATFTIIDSYDPFKPGNWPAGEEEVLTDPLKITPIVQQVRVENVRNRTEITITDAQGRIVRQSSVTENAMLDLSNERSGLYIIRAEDASSGQLQLQKFTKP